MTDTLRNAVAQAEALPEPDQDALAAMILAEIDAEAAWDDLFARPASHALLARMAAEATADDDAGRTRPLGDLLGDG